MKSVTLSAAGLKFTSALNTTVLSVTNPTEGSSIVLDSMPHVAISLGTTTAASLGLEEGSQVTITPVDGSSTNEFKLEVGKKAPAKKSGVAPARSNGCAAPMTATAEW